MSPGRPVEHLDVVVVGAGLSGIGAAHHLQASCPWASYAVLEARDSLGGTWDLFRYPGIRSDSDMFTLGYPFRPWTGERAIADGASILQYLRDTAADEGIDDHIRYGHRVRRADWSTDDARWTLTVDRLVDGEVDATTELTCSFLFSCSGYYRYDRGYQPDFPGMADFAGTIVHPQSWPEDLDPSGRTFVVIGSGATAVTLVPALARDAAHVTMLQRSPTYIASLPSRNPGADLLRRRLPTRVWGPLVRWIAAMATQGSYQLSRRRPEVVRRALRKGLEAELPEGYDIDTHFTPDYDPWDQRLCVVPDGDLFAAIRDRRASVETDHIETFTPDGIRLRSGRELDADVVVTATGLELLFLGGIEVHVDGGPVELTQRLTYKGMMIEGVPNLALAFGYTNASWTLKSDLTCEYVTKLLNHLRATGQRQATPRRGAGTVSDDSLLGLTAGYVQRAADRFPRQGDRFPWRVHQSYLRDYRSMHLSGVRDDVMVFSNPAPDGAAPSRAPSTERGERFSGRVAAITGAGSGIGRALAVELSGRGCHLALCDVDEPGLAETVALCEGAGVKVTSALVDVADRDAVESWADSVVAEHGRVNLVVNNAGVALASNVATMSHEDIQWLMGVNFWGVVHGTMAFLPHLRASGDGHVVNVSSVFGLVGVPSQSAYNASKFAVRGFTDALRIELDVEASGVSATTVHPGGIRTNIARNARIDHSVAAVAGSPSQARDGFDRVARTSPRRAARQILTAVERDRRRALIGADAVVFDLVARLPAGWYQRAVAAGARRRGRRRPS